MGHRWTIAVWLGGHWRRDVRPITAHHRHLAGANRLVASIFGTERLDLLQDLDRLRREILPPAAVDLGLWGSDFPLQRDRVGMDGQALHDFVFAQRIHAE